LAFPPPFNSEQSPAQEERRIEGYQPVPAQRSASRPRRIVAPQRIYALASHALG